MFLSTKSLIVNADDYGRTAPVSAGIRRAHLRGIVTTTTAMMNMPTVEDDLRRAMDECPRLGLGVHLVLTAGRPVLPPERVPSLVSGDGSFPTLNQLLIALKEMKLAELRAEWRAQIEKFLQTGAALDHLDSHHHASYFTETSFGIMLDLASEYGAPIRNPMADVSTADMLNGLPQEAIRDLLEFTPRLLKEKPARHPDRFVASFYGGSATAESLINILNALPDGVTEVMCHPGFVDDEILRGSSYNRQREQEITALTSAAVKSAVEKNGIVLASFRECGVSASSARSMP